MNTLFFRLLSHEDKTAALSGVIAAVSEACSCSFVASKRWVPFTKGGVAGDYIATKEAA